METSRPQETSIANWATLVLLALIWGSSFILMKKALLVYSADEVGAIRVASAAIFLFPVAIVHIRKFPIEKLKYILIMGMLGNFIPAFLFAKAQTQLASGLTGVLNALTPLFTLLVGAYLFKGPIGKKQSFGLVIGFLGSMGLILTGNGSSFGNVNFYAFFVVAASLCYATSTNVIKTHLTTVNALQLTAFGISFVGPLAIFYLFTTDFHYKIQYVEGAWLALFYLMLLGFLGTAVALVIFNMLIKNTSAVFASSVTYLVPMVAVAWGVLDGEQLFLSHYLGMLAIILGIYLSNRK